MITLASDCLMFQTQSGEAIPYSAEMISIEVSGQSGHWMDPEFVQQAAKAVFHYFKHDEGRQMITIAEFAGALEKALHKLGAGSGMEPAREGVVESDLGELARDSGAGCELFFFPLLRNEVREQMRKSPKMLRFSGLRLCVKRLTGARRWTSRCQNLQQQIVAYLQKCLQAEKGSNGFALLVQ